MSHYAIETALHGKCSRFSSSRWPADEEMRSRNAVTREFGETPRCEARRAGRVANEGVVPSFRFALLAFAKTEKEAERRQTLFQPAVLLARPRFQQEAHAYRRSTAVLTQGTRRPKDPASGHAFWDVD
jgi:hypothetical protein